MSLDKLKEQRDKLNACIQQQEARLKQSSRKIDTRKKILVGSYYLEQASKNGTIKELNNLIRNYLTRESDKRLFEIQQIEQSVEN